MAAQVCAGFEGSRVSGWREFCAPRDSGALLHSAQPWVTKTRPPFPWRTPRTKVVVEGAGLIRSAGPDGRTANWRTVRGKERAPNRSDHVGRHVRRDGRSERSGPFVEIAQLHPARDD